MRKLFLCLLLIGCTETDDMRLFQTFNTYKPIVDGGECIHLTPDAQGGDVGNGFTCTGLFYDKAESEARSDGKLVFWVSNDGRNQETGDLNFHASIVKLLIDYSAGSDGYAGMPTAEKLFEIDVEPYYDGTAQGIIIANDGTLYYATANRVLNFQKDGTYISLMVIPGANGLAYDSVSNTLLVKKGSSDTFIERWSMDGNLIDADVLQVQSNIDQIYLDRDDNNILYGGYGSNGSASYMKSYSISSGLELSTYGPYQRVQASEGISIVGDYLYYCSDAYFHHTNVNPPDLPINAIHKLNFTP